MSDHKKAVGTKAEVFHGTAKHTSGGLHKKDLMRHKGRIVSRKKHAAGKKAIQRLFKLGYKPTKGSFKAMKKGHSTRKHRGGFYDSSGNLVITGSAVSGGTPVSGAVVSGGTPVSGAVINAPVRNIK